MTRSEANDLNSCLSCLNDHFTTYALDKYINSHKCLCVGDVCSIRTVPFLSCDVLIAVTLS